MKKRLLMVMVIVIFCFSCVSAQAGWGNLLNSLANKAEKKVEEGTNGSGNNNNTTNNNANTNTAGNTAVANQQGSRKASGTAAASNKQPNLVATKIDFVPGEKTIFFDNFRDMPPGEPPPHWKVRGGAVVLRMGAGIRELGIPDPSDTVLTSSSFAGPKNFTFQAVMMNQCASEWNFRDKDNNDLLWVDLAPPPDGQGNMGVNLGPNSLGSSEAKINGSKPVELALWAQEGRVRVYINGQRVIDVNQVKLKGTVDHLQFQWTNWGGCGPKGNGLRSVRFAESVPDLGAVLEKTGKYVTHGIYFDTDSAILKPASGGVIKEISAALYKHPEMKLEIDGYTDSTGGAAHNLDLSKRRAEAVMEVLVSQFGIDQSRLTAKGFGSKNPIASNNTAEGRAQNRRVEFVKK